MSDSQRILVIDDDPSLLRSLRLILTVEGFDVETAVDGVDGLERLNGGSLFDVILLDLSMPRMDGRTFYTRLRDKGDYTPVMILSAYGAESARAELQADAAMDKPFEPDDLVDAVRGLASRNA